MVGAGYIPKMHWTDATANSEGLFAYYRYADASFILTCRTPDGTGSGWAGTTGVKDIDADRRRGAHRDRRRQGAEVAEAARDRAGQLHRHPRAAAGGALPVADARRAQRARGGRGPQLHERQGARRDQARREGVRRQRHDPQRDRQPDPAADAGRPRRPGRAATSPGSRRAWSRTSFYDRFWAQKQGKTPTPTTPQHEPGDGRRRRDARADDQVDEARPAGHVLLVHPRRSSR